MGDHQHMGGSREGEYWVIAEKYWDMWGDSWSVGCEDALISESSHSLHCCSEELWSLEK